MHVVPPVARDRALEAEVAGRRVGIEGLSPAALHLHGHKLCPLIHWVSRLPCIRPTSRDLRDSVRLLLIERALVWLRRLPVVGRLQRAEVGSYLRGLMDRVVLLAA